MGEHSADSDWKGDLARSVRRERKVTTEVDKQIDRSMMEVKALSNIAKAQGDLPTMYLANQAWRKLFDARADRAKRALALSNGERASG